MLINTHITRRVICVAIFIEFGILQEAVNLGSRAISLDVIFLQKRKQDRRDIYKISAIEMALNANDNSE